MARAGNPIREKARILWLQSGRKAKNIDLAEQLGVSSKSIQRWKKEDNWERTAKSAKTDKSTDTKKSGNKGKKTGVPALFGNQNAAGHGAPKGNTNALRTGKDSKRYWDCLNDEEIEMLTEMDDELKQEEQILIDQIALYTVRERRLMQLIETVRNNKKEASFAGSTAFVRMPTKDELAENPEAKSIITSTVTHTRNKIYLLLSLEDQLTRVQERKNKCVTALADIRLKRMKSGVSEGEGEKKVQKVIYLPDNGRG